MYRILILVVFLLAPQTSVAQLAGQRPGGCPERAIFTADQRAVVGGLAVLGDALDRNWFVPRADPVLVSQMVSCAHNVRYHHCADSMVFGLLDPVGAAVGGAAGIGVTAVKKEPSLLAGLLGAGGVGAVVGVARLANCNNRMEEQYKPAAQAALNGWQIDPNSLRPGDIQRRVAEAARRGIIAPADAEALINFADGAAILLQQ